MKLSTRSRYGMRIMLALAKNYGKGFLNQKAIAMTEEISQKYVSLLMIPLREAGLALSIRGAHGGYALAKAPSEINLGEIIGVLEGDCIVDCVRNPSACPRISICTSHDIWAFLDEKISETLRAITLEQRLTELEQKPRTGMKVRRRVQDRERIRRKQSRAILS